MDTGYVTQLDVVKGSILTSTSLDLPVYAMAVDARASRVVVDVSYARGLTSGIRIVDATSGKLLHRVNPNNYPGATMALDPMTGRAFVANYPSGYEGDLNVGYDVLNVVDTRTGRVLATTGFSGVGNDYHMVVDAPRRRVFVLVQKVDNAGCCGAPLGKGLVELFDARSGHLLHQVTVGRGAEGIALDAKMGRVFIANTDDDTVSVISSLGPTTMK